MTGASIANSPMIISKVAKKDLMSMQKIQSTRQECKETRWIEICLHNGSSQTCGNKTEPRVQVQVGLLRAIRTWQPAHCLFLTIFGSLKKKSLFLTLCVFSPFSPSALDFVLYFNLYLGMINNVCEM